MNVHYTPMLLTAQITAAVLSITSRSKKAHTPAKEAPKDAPKDEKADEAAPMAVDAPGTCFRMVSLIYSRSRGSNPYNCKPRPRTAGAGVYVFICACMLQCLFFICSDIDVF
jgi:hypothetical protein